MKKGEELWLNEHKKEALKYINGKITEDELMDYHLKNPSTYVFTLRALLQMGINYLSSFLMKLSSKENRRFFLMDPDFLGLSYEELETILPASSKKLNKFRFSDNVSDEYGMGFLALIALICRVPLHWLKRDNIYSFYEDDHLLYIPNSDINKEGFIKYLNYTLSGNKRNVSGFRLIIESYVICLRVEGSYGQINIEVLNGFSNEESKMIFEDLLEAYHPIIGRMSSVIIGRNHYGYIIKKENTVLTKPLYFIQ